MRTIAFAIVLATTPAYAYDLPSELFSPPYVSVVSHDIALHCLPGYSGTGLCEAALGGPGVRSVVPDVQPESVSRLNDGHLTIDLAALGLRYSVTLELAGRRVDDATAVFEAADTSAPTDACLVSEYGVFRVVEKRANVCWEIFELGSAAPVDSVFATKSLALSSDTRCGANQVSAVIRHSGASDADRAAFTAAGGIGFVSLPPALCALHAPDTGTRFEIALGIDRYQGRAFRRGLAEPTLSVAFADDAVCRYQLAPETCTNPFCHTNPDEGPVIPSMVRAQVTVDRRATESGTADAALLAGMPREWFDVALTANAGVTVAPTSLRVFAPAGSSSSYSLDVTIRDIDGSRFGLRNAVVTATSLDLALGASARLRVSSWPHAYYGACGEFANVDQWLQIIAPIVAKVPFDLGDPAPDALYWAAWPFYENKTW